MKIHYKEYHKNEKITNPNIKKKELKTINITKNLNLLAPSPPQ